MNHQAAEMIPNWKKIYLALLPVCLPWTLTPVQAAAPSAESLDFFERKIRPLLVERCYECHSQEAKKIQGGLLLDSREAVLKGDERGPIIVPGDPEHSPLLKVVRQQDGALPTPPWHQLASVQIADLESWVKLGAPDPRGPTAKAAGRTNTIDFTAAKKFWSFQPLQHSPPPAVQNKRWAKNPIDSFVLAKLEDRGMTPMTAASRRVLIRRATFDLTGLPPTPEEIEAFLDDRSSKAFEKVIDRLLASPRYGERWGRHWLDVVRYADTAGDSADYPVPQAYRYRDYVIDSFNRDKPYDQFIREQLAGDLLPADSETERAERTIATGFIATSRRFGVHPEMYLTIEDTIDVTGRALLGLTLSCARCHDHKFDPIPTQDYYALYGIFNSTRYPFPGSEEDRRQKDFVPLIAKEEVDVIRQPFQAKLEAVEAEIKNLTGELKAAKAAVRNGETPARNTAQLDKLITAAGKERDAILDQIPPYPTAFAVAESTPVNARVQKRGEPSNQGEEVPRRFLQVLGGQELPAGTKTSGRLELAGWIADQKNPLTARVMVNRIWQHHFGKGLVATPSDFGTRGLAPTHPELLDFLATRFIESGWSVKSMHRLMMLSATYQLASDDAPKNSRRDPNNDFLWRANRQRLDAEAIRDAMLFVSGELDLTPGGAHPFPPETKWNFTQHAQFNAVYESRKSSVYLMQQRIKKHPFFATFDGADANATTAARQVSTTPLQALFMMNDPFAHEQAEKFAVRLLGSTSSEARSIDLAWRLAYGRPATREEAKEAREFLRRHWLRLAAKRVPLDQRVEQLWAGLTRVLLGSNEFLFVD